MSYKIESLGKLRKQIGLTQSEFSKEAGVSQSLIAKIESGKIDPAHSKVIQIFETIDRLTNKNCIVASEIMEKNVIITNGSENLRNIAKLMREKAISQLPVVNQGSIVGLIREHDILNNIDKNLDVVVVEDIMTEVPPIISPDTKIEVMKHLIQHYPLLIVSEKGKIVGVVTKTDIIINATRSSANTTINR